MTARYRCASCGLYNMTLEALEVHQLGYPDHMVVFDRER